ncbi:methyltransferase-like protein 22 [Eublepharis macularius]|uniref:Methyltransferase-like protein 22 n=1 Tax=Eublepharis macularius TaxID=481883 RepID=A0AA97K4K1_EUBMA|nr:methyltransferase-like protein 22 [Eublepharis macularius]
MLPSLAHHSRYGREREAMDEVTFRSDTVLSDVHMHAPSKRHLLVRLNTAGQPVFLSQFNLLLDKSHQKKDKDFKKQNIKCRLKYGEELDKGGESGDHEESSKEGNGSEGIEALLDKDGDLEVVRKPRLPDAEAEGLSRDRVCPILLTRGKYVVEEEELENSSCDIIKIEHTMATPLEDVGKQVWRGAFLLVDYILSERDLFKGRTVLELGGGTGIVSIAMAMNAKTVYCTDVGEDLLDMCRRNVALNKDITEPAGSEVKVRVLDWLKDDFCTESDVSYSWSDKEMAELWSRFNFTLRHMDVACEAYCHFQNTLDDLVNIRDGRMSYAIEPLALSFPQHIVYERVEQLELWKITAVQTSRKSSSPEKQK